MTISKISLVAMMFSCLISFVLPLIFVIYFKHRKADYYALFTGIAVMILFVFGLEAVFHQLILQSSVGSVINRHIQLYALYGGLMAALFEEGGRWLAFRTVLRTRIGKDVDALMYGAGHGGCEAFLLGVTMLSNLFLVMNSEQLMGSLDENTVAGMHDSMAILMSTPWYIFFLAGLERIAAFAAQLSLSVLVWFSVKNGKKKYLLISFFAHFMLDAFAVILKDVSNNVILTEAFVFFMSAVIVVIARKIWCENRVLISHEEEK